MKHVFYIIISTLLLSCAQPVSPTGGDKDVNPPLIIKTNPANKSINIQPQKITIYFDENIQLTNPKQNIIISPNIPGIKLSNTNKTISISIPKDSLLENTTYSINLNNSITDVNENNPGIFKPFYFSTGTKLDTLKLLGKIEEYATPKIKNYKVYCYSTNNPSPLYKNNIIQNTFSIHGLDSTGKIIIAYNDNNNNDLADGGDDIGLLKETIPSTDSVTLQLIPTSKNKVSIYQTLENIKITGVQHTDREKIIALYKSVFEYKDTLIAEKELFPKILETLSKKYYLIQTTKPQEIPISQQYTQTYSTFDSNNIQLIFNQKITSIDKNKIKCTRTSDSNSNIPFTLNQTNNNITLNINTTERFNIHIPASTIELNGTAFNRNIIITEQTIKNNGQLTLNNNDTFTKYIQITKHNILFKIKPHSERTLYVPQGTYTIQYFTDLDNDGHITPPILDKLIPAEKLYYLKNVLVKANFNNNIILK